MSREGLRDLNLINLIKIDRLLDLKPVVTWEIAWLNCPELVYNLNLRRPISYICILGAAESLPEPPFYPDEEAIVFPEGTVHEKNISDPKMQREISFIIL